MKNLLLTLLLLITLNTFSQTNKDTLFIYNKYEVIEFKLHKTQLKQLGGVMNRLYNKNPIKYNKFYMYYWDERVLKYQVMTVVRQEKIQKPRMI